MNSTHYTFKEKPLQALCMLGLRLFTLVIVVAGLTLHLKSVKVFRWEQLVSGGVLVTYCLAALGLALCSGISSGCGGIYFQVYLTSIGAALFAINALVLWKRWMDANQLTRAMAELLQSVGVPIRTHLKVKIALSAIASIALIVDTAVIPLRNKLF